MSKFNTTVAPTKTDDTLLFAVSDIRISENIRDGGKPGDEEFDALFADIRENGQKDAVSVRRLPDRTLEAVDGRRRLTILRILAESDPSVRVRARVLTLNDEEALVYAIRGNLFRKDATPIENALNMRRLMEQYGYTPERVGGIYQVSAHRVNVLMQVLGMPTLIRESIASKEMSIGQAEMLLKMSGSDAEKVVAVSLEKVATDPNGKGPKITRMKGAIRDTMRDLSADGTIGKNGSAKIRPSGDLIDLLKMREDEVSRSVVAYLRNESDEGRLYEALDIASDALFDRTDRAEYRRAVSNAPSPAPVPTALPTEPSADPEPSALPTAKPIKAKKSKSTAADDFARNREAKAQRIAQAVAERAAAKEAKKTPRTRADLVAIASADPVTEPTPEPVPTALPTEPTADDSADVPTEPTEILSWDQVGTDDPTSPPFPADFDPSKLLSDQVNRVLETVSAE